MTGSSGSNRRGEAVLLLAVLGAMTLGILAPALDGDVFFSSEVIYCCTPPWNTAAEEGLGGIRPSAEEPHNEYLADHSTIYYPWLWATRQALRAGHFPLWSGESYGGVPYFGNFSVGLLSPFTWLFVWLPWEWSFAIAAAVKWILAGFGTFFLARRLGLHGASAVLPGVIYAFCGFQIVWINSALTHVSALAPWCFLAVDRLRERPSSTTVACATLAFFFQWMGGHPETSFYATLGALLFAWVRRDSREPFLKSVGMLGLALALAVGLSAIQLAPFLEYSLASEGLRLRQGILDRPSFEPWSLAGLLGALLLGFLWIGRRWLSRKVDALVSPLWWVLAGLVLHGLGMNPVWLLQLVPDLYGNPLNGGVYQGPLTYTDVTGGFCGSVAFLLALVAVARNSFARRMGFAALLLAARYHEVPWLSQTLENLPVFRQTGSTRALSTVALFLALLAGWGLRELSVSPRSVWRPLIASLAFALGLGLPLPAENPGAGSSPRSAAGFHDLPAEWNATEGNTTADHGFEIRGWVPRGDRDVVVRVNGTEIGPVRITEEAERRTFAVTWVGTSRLDEGRYRIGLSTRSSSEDEQELARSSLDLVRPYRWSWRLLQLPVALGLLLLALLLPPLRAVTLGAVVCAELCFFGADYNDVTPRERLPRAVEPIPQLQRAMREEGPFRILGARTALQPNLHYLFGLHALRGYDALEPRGYVAVLRYLFPSLFERIWFEQDFSTMDLESPLADVLNLRFVLSEEANPDPGWEERWRRGSLALFENRDVLPRVYAVQEIYSLAAHGNQPPPDLRSVAVWESGSDGSFSGGAQVTSFDYQSGAIAAEVESDAGTVLIASENWAPGWRVTVSDEPAVVQRTHGTLLSVEVPPGRHRVEFRYLPATFVIGAIVSATSLVLLLLLGPVGKKFRFFSRGPVLRSKKETSGTSP